jgi:hypothetical protein
MECKWKPCYCGIVLGIVVVVFTWLEFSWAQIVVTVAGGLIILKGLIGKCCCQSSDKADKAESCCR